MFGARRRATMTPAMGGPRNDHERAIFGQRERRVPWLTIGAMVLVGQLAWLVLQSVHVYDRFSLTSDFGLFYQAWHAIAGGHLDPTSTIYRTNPFVENHFELLVYPLALLEWIDPGGFILLVLQDLATVAAELVAFVWVLEILSEHWGAGRRSRNLVAAGALIVVAFDPWIWWSSAFDFHVEAFATLFALLATRSLWNRRWVCAVVFTVLTLSCGTVESVVLIGLGAGLVLSRRHLWRQGVALAAAAVAWVLALDATGFDKGSQLSTLYEYLTPGSGPNVHITQVVLGVFRHPHLVFDMVKEKRTDLWQTMAGAGLIGLASSIGIAVAAVLFVPAVLNEQVSVVQPEAAFQVLPIYVVFPVGAALLLCWLSRRDRPWRLAGAVIGLAALVEAVIVGVVWIPRAAPYFVRTDDAAAKVLDGVLARTPPGAEVVASNGFVGRFADRPWVYALEEPVGGSSVPVRSKVVEFVLSDSQGLETTPKATTEAAIGQVEHRLHARRTLAKAGIEVFIWHPAAGVRRFTLPGLAP